jgi:hypothetical protein
MWSSIGRADGTNFHDIGRTRLLCVCLGRSRICRPSSKRANQGDTIMIDMLTRSRIPIHSTLFQKYKSNYPIRILTVGCAAYL